MLLLSFIAYLCSKINKFPHIQSNLETQGLWINSLYLGSNESLNFRHSNYFLIIFNLNRILTHLVGRVERLGINSTHNNHSSISLSAFQLANIPLLFSSALSNFSSFPSIPSCSVYPIFFTSFCFSLLPPPFP